MTSPSRPVRLLVVAGLLLFAGPLGSAGQAAAGTLTIDSLSSAQQRVFWSKLDRLAEVESSVRGCGQSSNVESRFRAAVGSCLAPDAMSRVLSTFRQRLSHSRPSVSKASCGEGSQLADAKASADRMIAEAASLCGACRATGMCK